MLLLIIFFLVLNYFCVTNGHLMFSLVAWPLMICVAILTGGAVLGTILAVVIAFAIGCLPLLASVGFVESVHPSKRRGREDASKQFRRGADASSVQDSAFYPFSCLRR